jgi:hypothetical protein
MTLLLVTALASQADAASFTEVEASVHANWRAVLYRNDAGGRMFCAFESVAENPVLRLNSYLSNNDVFLEVFDPSWTKLEGSVRFSLMFDIPGQGVFEMKLSGQSWGDSYTHDILEADTLESMQALLVSGRSVKVENSNGATLAEYNLKGSRAAVNAFNVCRGDR